jgi:hypothetical protein
MHGISKLSIIPVRKDPSDRSEMVTQILFGETFELMESERSWTKIKVDYDKYIGWVDTKQISILDEEEWQKLNETPLSISEDLLQLVINGKEMLPVVLGSSLPFYYGKKFFIGENEFAYDGSVKTITAPDVSSIPQHAFMYLNAPYLWGGRSPLGLDCSGFTQMVFKLSGIKLLRDAFDQSAQGKKVSFEEIKTGDLAFFKNEDQRVVHVGIVLDNNRIIHSSGKVRIDKLDEEGIFNEETGKHTHKLAMIRRIA